MKQELLEKDETIKTLLDLVELKQKSVDLLKSIISVRETVYPSVDEVVEEHHNDNDMTEGAELVINVVVEEQENPVDEDPTLSAIKDRCKKKREEEGLGEELKNNEHNPIMLDEHSHKKTPPDSSILLKSLRDSPFHNRFIDPDRVFFAQCGRNVIAWESGNCEIMEAQLQNLIFKANVDDQVIDFFMINLRKNLSDEEARNTILLSTSAWRGVKDNNKWQIKRNIEEVFDKYRFDGDVKWIFAAINTRFRWHLLVLDVSSPKWRHFNSFSDRPAKRTHSSSIYAQDARKMRKTLALKIDQVRVSNGGDPMRNSEGKEMQIIYTPSPQQPTNSLDCALYVCKNIEDLLKTNDIPTSYTQEIIDDLRVNIANDMFSDIINSWKPSPDMFWTPPEETEVEAPKEVDSRAVRVLTRARSRKANQLPSQPSFNLGIRGLSQESV